MSAASLDDPGMDRGLESAVYRHEDFPGCESFHRRGSTNRTPTPPPERSELRDRTVNVP